MTTNSRIDLGAKKFQAGAAALAVATAAAITPVVSHAAPAAPLAPVAARTGSVLTWGFDQLDPALLAGNNKNNPQGAVAPNTNAAPTPGQLIQYLVQGIATGVAGIARGVVVIGGTVAYVGLAFTGGLITTLGNFLPGPIGDIITNLGSTVSQVANALAEAIHVGPYATASA